MVERIELSVKDGNDTIYGIMHKPEGNGPFPVVIMSHGYNGSCVDYENEAQLFAENGIAAYHYDFCGGSLRSKSTGRSLDMTLFTEEQNLLAVFDYVAGLEYIDDNKMFLMGQSMGGCVSTLAAQKLGNRVKRMLLYYPAYCVPDDFRGHFNTIQDIPEEFDLWGLKLGKDFSLSIRDFQIFDNIGKYEGKTLIIHGREDAVVNLTYAENAVKAMKNAELIVYEGEGHGFSPLYAAKAAKTFLEFTLEGLETL